MIDKAQGRILKAIEAGIVPDGTKERLDALKEERDALSARLELLPKAELPSVEEVTVAVQERLADFRPNRTLSELVGRVTVSEDAQGTALTAELPWLPALDLPAKNENPSAAGRSDEGTTMIGSPYQIRTGDLRLERAAS